MKKTPVYLIVALFAFSSLYATETSQRFKSKRDHSVYINDISYDYGHNLENININIDNGTIILEGRNGYDGLVEVTEDYELFVNGRKITLDNNQQELVTGFYDNFMLIIDEAKIVGLKGIGWEGAKLGFSAIGCLFKLLSTNYDEDDMERELEAKAEMIEEKAELLEEHAEELEEMAEELEVIFYNMEEEIPEIKELEWY